MNRARSFVYVFLLGFCFSSAASALTIKTNKVDSDKEELLYSVLKLALSKSAPNTKFEQTSEVMTEERLVSEVNSGNLDVMWAGASQSKEEQLKVIRIPVLKGMLGHRLLIIKKSDQHRFNGVKTLADLKQFKAGQGRFWGDTKVLKAGGIPTVTTVKYNNLFPMLEGGRFDYFPRAVHEPWSEVASRPELGLTVEKNLMLVYPFAMYFYVAADNQKLHDLIYEGFEAAIADGSFDELFFNNKMIKDVLEQAKLSTRTIIRIDNPFMHPDTPYDRKEFWLDVINL